MTQQQTGRGKDTREAIAAIVRSAPKGTHLTAPEVFERARELGLNVSLSTVYRILHRLKALGDVSTVSGERGLRYETAEEGEDHDHLICLGCGLTIEFVDDLIRGFGKTVANRKGFEHHSSRFDILGYCSQCNAHDDLRRMEQASHYLENGIEAAAEAQAAMKEAIDLQQSRKFARANSTIRTALERLKESIENAEASAAIFSDL